ncbi:guanine deaminase [Hydrocarboniclastica marina]|uniref:Guanine deaminase n=1 Tax=Hydrocarboniclastica marina TaxID=2259620 RepID=A0A4P7XKN5_9ALTE|nr:guanine deaminase [Hydrocarboniclastica marina]MAM00159.1 guanine deaminase [Alteromonadaceae bacterium]QCF27465.1 guanine deaminase [Hydrocarboniclastica marina]
MIRTTDVRFPVDCEAHRGALLHFLEDPGNEPEPALGATEYLEDGLLLIHHGKVLATGQARELLPRLAPTTPVTHWQEGLILPGFIDTHVHMPQLGVMASYGTQLLDWLETYTFPHEARFSDRDWARTEAHRFADLLLAHGTTSGLVFCTSHANSVEALFEAAEARSMGLTAGKVMMDRHAPDDLIDTPETSYQESHRLLEKWHGRGRQRYAITPRFAATSSPQQLSLAGKLSGEFPQALVQTHWAENLGEIQWIRELFPQRASYLDVYDHYGLLGNHTVLAHGIHIDDGDRKRLKETGARIAFCPTSNTFLGSGLFDFRRAREAGINVGLASDVGGGTSLSMLATMGEAYKVCRLQGQTLTPWQAFYLATLGNARVLHQDHDTGSLQPGRHADFVVLDPSRGPLLAMKKTHSQTLAETLFDLMILGDDRAVTATFVAGTCQYRRPPAPAFLPSVALTSNYSKQGA